MPAQAYIASLDNLPALVDQLYGAGQGLGAQGVNYNIAGGKKAFAVAAERAKISGQTVGQELALMEAEKQAKGAAAGAKVRVPCAFPKTLAVVFQLQP